MGELVPVPGLDGILAGFDRAPVVAVGELHRVQELADTVIALLHHPRFADHLNDIVVEFGNARHQTVMDRFIGGEPVEASDLRQVWRDHTSARTIDAPIYERFFRTVRAVNRTLAAGRRIRVILADPPVNWVSTRSMDDLRPYLDRDRHMAQVVEREVLARGRRALLLAGTAHVVRVIPPRWTPSGPDPLTAVNHIEARWPGSIYAIIVHVGFKDRNSAYEPRLCDWPVPALAPLRGTWLGALEAGLVLGSGEAAYRSVTLADAADAYLYLGPRDSLTASHPNPAIYRGDPEYVAELARRHLIMFDEPLDLDDLMRPGPVRYQRPDQPA
jgi:hypothetical protein